jgi:nitrate/nitrite transport system substrate-binding protein
MAQYTRFGMAPAQNYKPIAEKLIMDDLYAEVAKSMGIAVPADGMKAFKTNLEPTIFDPNNPAAYIAAAKK